MFLTSAVVATAANTSQPREVTLKTRQFRSGSHLVLPMTLAAIANTRGYYKVKWSSPLLEITAVFEH